MRDYKIPIFIALTYCIALFTIPAVRSLSIVLVIFLMLQFLFHGIFVVAGKRATNMHKKFTQSHMGTVVSISLLFLSTGIYIAI